MAVPAYLRMVDLCLHLDACCNLRPYFLENVQTLGEGLLITS